MTVAGDLQIVVWPVDNLMALFFDGFENRRLIHFLRMIQGDNMSITRGKMHTYLRMDWNCSIEGKVQVVMAKHINTVFQDFPEIID